MSDEIIDLSEYLAERQGPRAFSVVGGEGERSRFALPVWRAIYVLDGDRGGIVWIDGKGGAVRSLFVLDLAESPARTAFDDEGVRRIARGDPPVVDLAEGASTVLLAQDDRRSWFLIVTGARVGREDLTVRKREDLLFLAGECAGLLLHRELGKTAD